MFLTEIRPTDSFQGIHRNTEERTKSKIIILSSTTPDSNTCPLLSYQSNSMKSTNVKTNTSSIPKMKDYNHTLLILVLLQNNENLWQSDCVM